MGDTVGNIIARVGCDSSQLQDEMKKCTNTILTFKDKSLAALKSFGLPQISSTNLVEAIQSGQRVVVNFARESNESLAQFQERVRATFLEAGIDITAYEAALTDADKVHAEFAKGAVKNFQAVSAAAEEVNNKAEEFRSSLGNSFTGIQANFGAFKDSVVNAFQTMTNGSATFGDKIGAVSNAVVDGFGLMTGAIEIFIALEVVKKVGEWIDSLKELAAETQDAEHRFYVSMGQMSEEAEEFSKKLADSYGIDQEAIQNMMAKEYTNTRMLGFDPTQAEDMSEHITQLAYDLGKLRGIDPSQAFDALQRGIEGQTRGLMDLGIRITSTDLKNRALSEGLIQQGQTMTDAQTSAVAYQMIMEKLHGTMGYYQTTSDDISTQQTKLNAGWEEMKRSLADDLTPAFAGLLKLLNFVATGFEEIVEVVGAAIKAISLFAEDAYSAIKDVMTGNFGAIGSDWSNNAASIYDSSQAAKDFGNAMDNATTAANNQDQAQKTLNKSLNANTMSFDELHNISNSGTDASNGQAAAIKGLAEALKDLKPQNMGDLNDKQKGLAIPVRFKIPPIPPIPPLPPQPPLLFTAKETVSPVVAAVKAKVGELPKRINVSVGLIGTAAIVAAITLMEEKISEWEAGAVKSLNTVTETVSEWEANAKKAFDDVQTVLDSWAKDAVTAFGVFTTALETDFSTGFASASASVGAFEEEASGFLASFATNAIVAMNTFKSGFQSAWDSTLEAAETKVESWATKVENAFSVAVGGAMSEIAALAKEAGETISNVGTKLADWANNNKGILAGAAAVGLTVATGGSDLVVGGIASALGSLADIGAGFGAAALAGVSRFATGGIVTAPTLGVFGEAGPEAVIPLSQIESVMRDAMKGGSNSITQAAQPVNITLQLDGRTLARALYSYTINESDRLGKTIGYNLSYNYPK